MTPEQHAAAVAMGRMTSEAKKASSSANGKKGGRPRKNPTPPTPLK